MSEGREYTTDEVRAMFLRQVWAIIDLWVEDSRVETPRGKVEGAAFSILSLLDGSNMIIPGFIVAPNPHPTDRECFSKRGENYFPDNNEAAVNGDIGGSLHELFHQANPRPKLV